MKLISWIYDDIRLNSASIERYIKSWAYFHFVKEAEPIADWRREDFIKHSPQAYAALFDHMYGNLNILDGKARALISSTSILTAILSILIFKFEHAEGFFTDCLLIATLFSLFSMFLGVLVVSLYWSTPDQLRQPDLRALVVNLVKVRNRRTICYRLAWLLHLVVMAVAFLLLLSRLASMVSGP